MQGLIRICGPGAWQLTSFAVVVSTVLQRRVWWGDVSMMINDGVVCLHGREASNQRLAIRGRSQPRRTPTHASCGKVRVVSQLCMAL